MQRLDKQGAKGMNRAWSEMRSVTELGASQMRTTTGGGAAPARPRRASTAARIAFFSSSNSLPGQVQASCRFCT